MPPIIFLLAILPGHLMAQDNFIFDRLTGVWESTTNNQDRQSFEVWEKVDERNYLGIGYTLENGDTSFVELLKIVQKAGSWYYVADVEHNPQPVVFELVFLEDNFFTCINPEHDFPTFIKYSFRDEELDVMIAGEGKSTEFHFVKSR